MASVLHQITDLIKKGVMTSIDCHMPPEVAGYGFSVS
jgi:hypothetical protein